MPPVDVDPSSASNLIPAAKFSFVEKTYFMRLYSLENEQKSRSAKNIY